MGRLAVVEKMRILRDVNASGTMTGGRWRPCPRSRPAIQFINQNILQRTSMRYFAVCSFDLTETETPSLDTAHAILEQLGFHRQISSGPGSIVDLPSTTVAGFFEGESEDLIRDTLTESVRRSFAKYGLKGTMFVMVSQNMIWSLATN